MSGSQQVRDLIRAGEFKHQLPYPPRGDRPGHAAWNDEDRAIRQKFRSACETAFDIASVPQSALDLVWVKAWDDGHSAGYEEILIHYEELADIVKAAQDA